LITNLLLVALKLTFSSNRKFNDGTATHTGSSEGTQVVKKVAVKRKLKDESKVKYDGSKEKTTTAGSAMNVFRIMLIFCE